MATDDEVDDGSAPFGPLENGCDPTYPPIHIVR